MDTLLNFFVRLILLVVGLVFAAGLAVLFLIVLMWAGLYTAWARLLGRPAPAFVFRVDPRAGFERFYRARKGVAPAEAEGGRQVDSESAVRDRPRLQGSADVTDVEPRRPRD